MIPLIDGVDAFYARAVLIKSAERSLDLQYFLWHKDLSGQVLLKHVLDAGDRGVRVRILLDDLDNQALDPEFYALDTHPNISIRLFNPFATRGFKYIDFFADTARVNRRMHNKSLTADNQYTIIGGRNIGDEYFDAQQDTNFYDFDVLVTGPAVHEVSEQFDIYWNHETAVPVNAFEQNTASASDLERVRDELTQHWESALESEYADLLRNIGDEYFDAQKDTNFYDFDVLVTGPAVHEVSEQFDIYWNHETAVPVNAFEQNTASASDLERVRDELTQHWESALESEYADDVRSADFAHAMRGETYPAYTGVADVVYDDPDKGLGKPPDEIVTMEDLMNPYFENVSHEIILKIQRSFLVLAPPPSNPAN